LGSGRGREIYVRHERALAAALEEARRGREALRGEVALELVAEHLRRATDALDQVSGSTTAEDVLDRIFAAFCLGK
jgi:tRNA modification GTPase